MINLLLSLLVMHTAIMNWVNRVKLDSMKRMDQIAMGHLAGHWAGMVTGCRGAAPSICLPQNSGQPVGYTLPACLAVALAFCV